MAFVQFTKVSLAYGDRDLLSEVGLNLASGSRAALAGANGSGKSTLMKVIAGKIEPDSGERAVQKGTRVSYLPQSGLVHRGRTLLAEVELAFTGIASLLTRLEELGAQLSASSSADGTTSALVEEHHELQEAIEASGWYERRMRIDMVLSGLGFSPDDLDRKTEEFSGGWQMRIALAKVLLESPDILLLDEPTNYLDIEARGWLELWLRNFRGGYLLVSHDRYFLDVCTDEVYELFQGTLKRYVGNYTSYEKVRKVELESLLARYEIQKEEIARTEDFIRRFRYQATKAAMVQDRVKRLEKMEKIEIPESLKKIHFSFPPPPHSGRIAMTLEGVGKCYGERRVLSRLDLVIEAREKLVIVGRNGAGKSTLLRILSGEDRDFEGSVTLGTGIEIGYFSQDIAEKMGGSDSVLEHLEKESPLELIPKLRDMLGSFLFRGDDVHKSISVLSGGEKSRLALLKLLLKPVNLLILDEPTNHLDLHSKDVLLDALTSYEGTVLFVSHDRYFMEALATKTLELSPAGPRVFVGNYGDYLYRLEREELDPSLRAASPEADVRRTEVSASLSSSAEKREQDKKRQTSIRRLEREEAEVLARMEAIETEKSGLELSMGLPEVYSDGVKSREIQKGIETLSQRMEGEEAAWERISGELASLRNEI